MRQSIFFTVFNAVLLSVLAAPGLSDKQLVARQTYTGRGTWFYPGLGACGRVNGNSDLIVALSTGMYGNGEHCGQGISITNTATGATVYTTVVDECPGCGYTDLDMSPGAFEQIGDLNTGVLSISWNFA